MADNTAALVVALSAQLTKFEKDMKDAVKIADNTTKSIETSFSKMNKNIENEFSSFIGRYTAAAGPIGNIISGLGPIGLAIAGTIGAATLAIGFLVDKTQQYIDKQKAMREMAETTGLSLDALKVLGITSGKVGVDIEKTERAINKLSVELDQLRTKGEGPLATTLDAIDPKLTRQVISANSLEEAVSIVAKALVDLDDAQRQAGASAELFGVKNLQVLRVFKEIAAGGGLDTMIANLRAAGKGVNEDLNKNLVTTEQEIKKIRGEADTAFGRMFAAQQQQAQKETAQVIKFIADSMESILNSARQLPESLIPPATPSGNERPVFPSPAVPPRSTLGTTGAPVARGIGFEEVGPQFAVQETAVENLTRAIGELNKEFEKEKALTINAEDFAGRWAGILGTAATPAEQLAAKQAELNKQVRANIELQPAATRALKELTLVQQEQLLSVRERLGIASEDEIIQVKLNRLNEEAAKLGLTKNDVLRAENIIRKEGLVTAQAEAVRASRLPELTRLGQDAQNLQKQIDTLGVTTFSNFENAMADVAVGAKSLQDAFKSLTDSIIRDLVRMTLRMSVTGPLASALGGLFGGTVPGATTTFGGAGSLGVPTFPRQGGGPVFSGTPYVVGEHGRELFVPHTSGQIIPGNVSGGKTGGGTTVQVNNYVAADTETKQTNQQGPNGETIVIDIVKKAQARGEFDATNRGRFGLRPNKVR